jgi:hypothetical protein
MEEKELQVISFSPNPQAFGDFVEAQAEIGNVTKNRKGYGYRYADLGQLLDEVKPVLGKYHFAVVWELTTFQERLAMLCKVMWKDGSCVAQSTCPLLGIQEQPMDGGAKTMNPMQQVGSAITYARRYTLLNCLCVACEDDDAQSLSPVPKIRNDNGY